MGSLFITTNSFSSFSYNNPNINALDFGIVRSLYVLGKVIKKPVLEPVLEFGLWIPSLNKPYYIANFLCKHTFLACKQNRPFEASKHVNFIAQTGHGAWQNVRFETPNVHFKSECLRKSSKLRTQIKTYPTLKFCLSIGFYVFIKVLNRFWQI